VVGVLVHRDGDTELGGVPTARHQRLRSPRCNVNTAAHRTAVLLAPVHTEDHLALDDGDLLGVLGLPGHDGLHLVAALHRRVGACVDDFLYRELELLVWSMSGPLRLRGRFRLRLRRLAPLGFRWAEDLAIPLGQQLVQLLDLQAERELTVLVRRGGEFADELGDPPKQNLVFGLQEEVATLEAGRLAKQIERGGSQLLRVLFALDVVAVHPSFVTHPQAGNYPRRTDSWAGEIGSRPRKSAPSRNSASSVIVSFRTPVSTRSQMAAKHPRARRFW